MQDANQNDTNENDEEYVAPSEYEVAPEDLDILNE